MFCNQCFRVEFDEGEQFNCSFGESIVINSYGDYSGSYIVPSSFNETTILDTSGKVLTESITVTPLLLGDDFLILDGGDVVGSSNILIDGGDGYG